jgi:ATP-dependent helicase/nuclease subunit A
MTSPLKDSIQRQEAVLTDKHAFVWASAGTGKTHTLALRALYLLMSAPLHGDKALYKASNRAERLRAARRIIQSLVLTTFTRKAAAEMQTRLYAYLDRIVSADSIESVKERLHKPDDLFLELLGVLLKHVSWNELRQGAEALAELASELQVSTLHSLAITILRRHPLESGVPPTARFAEEDGETFEDIGSQLVSRWWEMALRERTLSEDLRLVLKVAGMDEVSQWLGQAYEHPGLVAAMNVGEPDERVIQDLLEATRQLVAVAPTKTRAPKVQEAGKKLADALEKIEAYKPGAWSEFQNVLMGLKDVFFCSKPTKAATEAVESLGPLAKYYRDSAAIAAPVFQKVVALEKANEWAAWRRVVQHFADWSRDAAMRELGVVTFDEMIRLAAQLLKNHPAVRKAEHERLAAVLMDEFQDTDPTQLELISELLRRDSNESRAVVGFFVGDRKQAIYGFKGTDLEAIEAFRRNYAGLVKSEPGEVLDLYLRSTFRNVPEITDFVNAYFSKTMELPGYAKESLEPVKPPGGSKPRWIKFEKSQKGENAETMRMCAGLYLGRMIQEHVEKGGSYGDYLLLGRTHTELNPLLLAMEECGVPVVSAGAKVFYTQVEVTDVLNLLIALEHPGDSVAVAAVLRSPIVCLSDPEIHRLLSTIPAHEVFHSDGRLEASLPQAARERIGQLRKLASDRLKLPAAEWIRQVRRVMPVGAYADPLDREGKAMVRVEVVFDLYRQHLEKGTEATVAWLVQQRRLSAGADRHDLDAGEDVSITDESVQAVRVMTVHKAKGLQGKIVVVFGWESVLEEAAGKRRGNRNNDSVVSHGGRCGFDMPWGNIRAISTEYTSLLEAKQQREKDEARRLAYVATTRAEESLLLLEPMGKAPDQFVLEGYERDVVVPEDQPATASVDHGADLGDTTGYVAKWNARRAAWAEAVGTDLLRKPSQPERPAEEEDREQSEYVGELRERSRQTSMAAGTLVHAYLEHHARDKGFETAKLEALRSWLDDDTLWGKAQERAADVLKRFFKSAEGERLRTAKILGREVPVQLMFEGKAWTGVMDAVLEEGGKVVGVDYKITKDGSGLSLKETYRQQERVYSEVLRRLFPGREVGFEFWWLDR